MTKDEARILIIDRIKRHARSRYAATLCPSRIAAGMAVNQAWLTGILNAMLREDIIVKRSTGGYLLTGRDHSNIRRSDFPLDAALAAITPAIEAA